MKAVSVTPAVKNWLATSRDTRILHIFDQVCNLVNERGEVLSIVSPQIGNGPFNLVMKEKIPFSDQFSLASAPAISENRLHLGPLTIDIANASLWNPRPNWGTLYARRHDVLPHLTKFSLSTHRFPTSLCISLADADLDSTAIAARQLAGLGIGLTPAGDDFILGALLAAWIIHPPQVAGMLAKNITDATAPLTTSLSAAWLRSAGKGEAGTLWHEFFEALLSDHSIAIRGALERLLAVGHTSGVDALAGFTATFISNAKRETTRCPS